MRLKFLTKIIDFKLKATDKYQTLPANSESITKQSEISDEV
jgi:hypothetical protein